MDSVGAGYQHQGAKKYSIPSLIGWNLPPAPGDDRGKVLSVHGGKRGTSRCLSAQLMPPLGHGLRDGIQSLGVLHILAENSRNRWKPWAPAPPPSLCCLFLIITGPSQVVTICLNSLDAPPPQTVSSSQHKEPWEGSEFLISVAGIPLCPAPPDHCRLGAGPQRADS